MEHNLQEALAGLEEAKCKCANTEKKGKMSQGLMVASNQKLDKMVQALYEADFTKKEV